MPHASAYETVLILSIYIRAAAAETATKKLDDSLPLLSRQVHDANKYLHIIIFYS